MNLSDKYPGLIREQNKNGKIRWRVRVKGDKKRRITLEVAPNHADFDAHYAAAREGRKYESKTVVVAKTGSLDDLKERFLAWMAVQVEAGSLSQLTLNSRKTALTQACNVKSPAGPRMGILSANLSLQAFAYIRDSFGTRTGAASTCIKALRAAYTWGAEHGFPEDSPVFKLKNTHVEKGGAVPWSDEDIAQFLFHHGPGTMARRWYFLARDTSGRIGDTRWLGRANEVVIGNTLYIAWQPTKKGSEPVRLPLSPELIEELADMDPKAPAYILNSQGKPYASRNALDNAVRRWVIEAGLYEEVVNAKGEIEKKATRSQHGIRKRRAIDIAEAGGSEFEVMAHLSHRDPQTSRIYTKGVHRAMLAELAADRASGGAKNVLNTHLKTPDFQKNSGEGVPNNENRGTLSDVRASKANKI